MRRYFEEVAFDAAYGTLWTGKPAPPKKDLPSWSLAIPGKTGC